MIDIISEKYQIFIEANGSASTRIRYGFGVTSEEVQKILGTTGIDNVRVKIEGTNREVSFMPSGSVRLVDIKQKIKSLSFGKESIHFKKF